MRKPVGILGLGRIGGTAARMLQTAGHTVAALERPSSAWLAESGGVLVPDAATLAADCGLVIGALASEDAVEEAVFGAAGLVAGAHSDLVYADMGTFSVSLKERVHDALAQAGACALDTPVSGNPEALEAGRAVIMLSGDEEVCESVRPVLQALTDNCPYLGPYGHGMKMKFVLNAMVTNHVLVAAEALNMATASGLDPDQVIGIVSASVATSAQFELRGPRMAEGRWQPAPAPARLVHKDLAYIVDHARALGVAAPVVSIVRDYYDKVAAAGRLEDEIAVIYEMLQAENEPRD